MVISQVQEKNVCVMASAQQCNTGFLGLRHQSFSVNRLVYDVYHLEIDYSITDTNEQYSTSSNAL